MSNKQSLERIAKAVAALPAPAALAAPTEALPISEAHDLAREMIRGLNAELAAYRRAKEREKEKLADPAEPTPDWYANAMLECPPEDVTFGALERIARHDAERMHARWEQVKRTAADDLTSGWLAARALEELGGSAWERACFLATRQALRQTWLPRSDGEAMLLDEMAQYEMLRRRWVGVLGMLSRSPATINQLGRPCDRNDSPRDISASQATNEAVRMVERLQRLYQNALRSLLSLRRGKPAVFVGRAEQVNLAAGPQMNFHSDAPPPRVHEGPPDGRLLPTTNGVEAIG